MPVVAVAVGPTNPGICRGCPATGRGWRGLRRFFFPFFPPFFWIFFFTSPSSAAATNLRRGRTVEAAPSGPQPAEEEKERERKKNSVGSRGVQFRAGPRRTSKYEIPEVLCDVGGGGAPPPPPSPQWRPVPGLTNDAETWPGINERTTDSS